MITPERAPVRPRVKRKGGETSFLLEDEIAELAAADKRGIVILHGKSGSGKTAALRHLAAVLEPSMAVQLLDPCGDQSDAAHEMAVESLANHALIVTTASLPTRGADLEFELVHWSQDEWIEYLLAQHREQCKSVMARLLADEHNQSALFTAEIWRVVLDEMAADETVASPLDAMVCRVSRQFMREQQLALSPLALNCIRTTQFIPWADAGGAVPDLDRPTWRILNQPPVVSWIAAAYAAKVLKEGSVADEDWCLASIEQLPRSYLYNLAALTRSDEVLSRKLYSLVQADIVQNVAAAVSVLHLAGTLPQPAAETRPVRSGLAGAILEGVQWPGVSLKKMDLIAADFSAANLSNANLDSVLAGGADFSQADLRHASLRVAKLNSSILTGANLSRAVAPSAIFSDTDCRNAVFNDADLYDSTWLNADLTGASYCRANLSQAVLRRATIDGADFTAANLTRARLDGWNLAAAQFRHARFTDATLVGCSLDGVELPGADCEGANFTGATFTGALMPGANLCDANLRGCGLADVDWEGADLRNADLRDAVFSMGGSRSGLVGSPYPGHGTRTGFYTDDFNDLSTHKHPEEIRKANLCGADLRGANIEGVDFYLVDLRGALYDPDQAEQLRKCGAILKEPVA
jgi:uncharacterized protein YjbI with pentapeptide repeats